VKSYRPRGSFSAREVEVLRLLALGMSNKEIAQRLLMSPKTAGNHIEHIYAKIDATNRAAASLFAVHHGLLAADDAIGPTDARRERQT
jgi:DNA-binding CsgD family transcriptional regulator